MRTSFSGGLRRSTVAHFARKVRGANIVMTKHGLKIQQSYAQKRWSCSLRVRGPHFASKVSYNAGAATDDYAGQRKSPLRGRCCQYLIFYLEHPKVMHRPCNPYQGRRITLRHQFSKERTVPSRSLSFCLHAALSFILFYPC